MQEAESVDNDAACPTESQVTAREADPVDELYARLYARFDAMLDDMVRIPGHPAWIILCGYHIGETAEFCALANAFVETHGHGIILIVRPMHAAVAQMYAHRFLKILVLQDEMMNGMLRSGYIPQDRFELDQPISACWGDRGLRDSNGMFFLGRYPGRGGISQTDMMRFVLRLPWNARLEPPHIRPEWERRAWDLAQENGMRMGRSVVLCPINNTVPRFPQIFWDTVAARLNELGYTVYTNIGGLNRFNGLPNMPIAGTRAVSLPIELVVPFAHLAGRIVISTNGMSLLTMLSCWKSFKMTQLLPVSKDAPSGHSSLGERAPPVKGDAVIGSFHYLSPELCLNAPLNEFLLPFDESPEEMQRLARVVAEQDTSDPSCFKRLEMNGKLFIEEHADWLQDLTSLPM